MFSERKKKEGKLLEVLVSEYSCDAQDISCGCATINSQVSPHYEQWSQYHAGSYLSFDDILVICLVLMMDAAICSTLFLNV